MYIFRKIDKNSPWVGSHYGQNTESVTLCFCESHMLLQASKKVGRVFEYIKRYMDESISPGTVTHSLKKTSLSFSTIYGLGGSCCDDLLIRNIWGDSQSFETWLRSLILPSTTFFLAWHLKTKIGRSQFYKVFRFDVWFDLFTFLCDHGIEN